MAEKAGLNAQCSMPAAQMDAAADKGDYLLAHALKVKLSDTEERLNQMVRAGRKDVERGRSRSRS